MLILFAVALLHVFVDTESRFQSFCYVPKPILGTYEIELLWTGMMQCSMFSFNNAIYRSGLCLLSSVNNIHMHIVRRTYNHVATSTVYKEIIYEATQQRRILYMYSTSSCEVYVNKYIYGA